MVGFSKQLDLPKNPLPAAPSPVPPVPLCRLPDKKREHFGVKKEWVEEFELIPIIDAGALSQQSFL